MVLSRKLVAAVVTTALLTIVGWVVQKFGVHVDTTEAQLIASAVAVVAGAVSGYVAKEAPAFLAQAEQLVDEHTTSGERAEVADVFDLGKDVAESNPFLQAEYKKLKAEIEQLETDAAASASGGNTAKAAELVSYANAKRAVLTRATTP